MAREQNFLLGRGERMTKPVTVPSGGAPKKPPYDFSTAQKRVASRLNTTIEAFASIPKDATPNDQVAAVLTMHPRYISKSDFPNEMLKSAGLQVVGSRSRSVKPDAWGIKKPPESAVTEDLIVVGSKNSFTNWGKSMSSLRDGSALAATITHIEDLKPFRAKDKIRFSDESKNDGLFEIVLHNLGKRDSIKSFIEYARQHKVEVFDEKQRDVRGLTFIPVRANKKLITELAEFTLVRAARHMPILRPFPTSVLRSVRSTASLPDASVLDGAKEAAIFDGGLSPRAAQMLSRWVTHVEPAGIGQAVPEYQVHGLAVTSAFLFGPLHEGQALPTPFCKADHIRVLDENSEHGGLEMVDVLDRILAVLDGTKKYDFVNLSLGPNYAMEDDDVSLWTAALDQRLAGKKTVTTVAAGNDGDLDPASGLNRVQPPGDAVNLLSVGSSDKHGPGWKRAPYSCVGPGRCPGFIKPDGVFFGGNQPSDPFMVIDENLKLLPVEGTSFASPSLLRTAAAVTAQLGSDAGSLAVRALLVHHADRGKHSGADVGWGRFESDPKRIVTCDDDEVTILYQGELPVGEHLRADIPLPGEPLKGNVILTATLVISPEVDPEHPGAYTQSGLEVMLRPHSAKYTVKDGKRSHHPTTKAFFSSSNIYGAEYALREGGHKWEPCIRNSKPFRAGSLKDPCFDIYYHQRESGGKKAKPAPPLPYALVVSIKAARVKDLYNQVVRTHTGLVPIRPRIQLPIQVRS